MRSVRIGAGLVLAVAGFAIVVTLGVRYDAAAWPTWAVWLSYSGLILLVLGALLMFDPPRAWLRRTARLAAVVRDGCVSLAEWLWAGRRWWASDAPGDGTTVRRLLYTAWAATAGATLGWMVWIVGDITIAHPRDIAVSAVVGGILGVGIAGAERYAHARRLDASGDASGTPAKASARILVSVALLVFGRAALEDTSGDLVKAVYGPLFISIVTFLPAAAILGAALHWEPPETTPPVLWWLWIVGALGFPVGWAIGTVVFLLDAATGTRVGWLAVCGWWAMLCVSAFLVRIYGRLYRRGALTISLIIVGLAVLAVYGASTPAEVEQERTPKGKWIYATATWFGGVITTAPDVPARTWELAEARLRSSGTAARYDPSVPRSVTGPFGRLIGCDHVPTVPSRDEPRSYLDRKRRFCAELHEGFASGLARSVIVLAGFFVGLGFAGRLDARFIPADYATSHTRRYDRLAAVATIVVVAAGAVTLRFA